MRCILCSRESVEFLNLGKQPMANKYPKKNGFKLEDFFNVKVFFCPNCKNIQLNKLVSRKEMFEDYYYLSSVNEELVRHYEEFAKTLKGAKFVVDIGSNDGISLKPLKKMGVKAIGIDPSKNVGKIANAAGFKTLVRFFDSKTVSKVFKEYGKADVITGLSMFSHLQDQHTFIEDVKDLLTDDGRLIIEVEYNKAMLDKMSFERFYLDRILYFSVTSFQKFLQLHDMYLYDAEITKIHGGSLRITAQKRGFGKKPKASVQRLIDDEATNLTLKTVKSFGKNAKILIQGLKDRLKEYKARGLTIAGYGSPARVATLTNFGNIDTRLIDFIVDDSPLKQGRFSPGKHIPIVSNQYLKEHKVDVLLFFAYESFKDIQKKLNRKYINVFPIPVREVK